MEIVDRLANIRKAWGVASSKGYFRKAIIDYTAPDFVNFIGALLPGLLIALAVPIAGQIAGTMAGTAVGVAITAVTGQAEVIPFTAEIGATLGAFAASFVLVYMGLAFLKEFVLPRIGAVGQHLSKGCELAYNAPPNAGDMQLDAAAQEMADGIGYLLGLVLMAIVLYMTKGPANRMAKLNESFLARTCPKVMEWTANNLTWLMERYRSGPTRVPGGALPPPPEVYGPKFPRFLTAITDEMLNGGDVGETKAFKDFPTPIEGQSLGKILPMLEKLGFRWVQLTTVDATGKTTQSNIYFRLDSAGRFTGEAIRIDPRGHGVSAKIPKVETIKRPVVNQKVAYGEVRHFHKAYINPAEARRFVGGYDPALKVTEFNDYNQPVKKGTMSNDDYAGFTHIWVQP